MIRWLSDKLFARDDLIASVTAADASLEDSYYGESIAYSSYLWGGDEVVAPMTFEEFLVAQHGRRTGEAKVAE